MASSGINQFDHDIEVKFFVCCMNEVCEEYGNEVLDTEARSVSCYHDGRLDDGYAEYEYACPTCGKVSLTCVTERKLDCFSGEY